MKLVAFVGTNASLSYNRKLLAYMQRHFASRAEINIVEIGNLPMFRENAPLPEIVEQLDNLVKSADGVIFGTPEYDHSIPAVEKNAIEWMSSVTNPLKHKPVMIVGTSLGAQGTVRAQGHLRQILDSPGVDAHVMSGHEFELGYAPSAFNANNNLTDRRTIKFLETCFSRFELFVSVNSEGGNQVIQAKQTVLPTSWNKTYDVVVIGFGAAGASAARFAADNGASVLLVDAAPLGHEGGNTRYAGQIVLTGYDRDQVKKYMQTLFGSIQVEDDILNVYIDGITNMRDYFIKYLDVKDPVSYRQSTPETTAKDTIAPEYPEFPGADTMDETLVSEGAFNASLWKNLRQHVMDRDIDVWLETPAKHLIQNPDTRVIEGVQVSRHGQTVNIQARNGVVMAMGGFENDPEAIQSYIGAPKLKVIGTLYNRGDGVRMAQEVGAKLWHMSAYAGYGFDSGFTFENPSEERGKFIHSDQPSLYDGSIFVVGDDGSRYLREDEAGRHGFIYSHGGWRHPDVYNHPYVVFDQAQADKIKADANFPYPEIGKIVIQANNLEDLAAKMDVNPEIFVNTAATFNQMAKQGRDMQFNRDGATMQPLSDQGPYYAAPLATGLLNTQGGAKRNAKAEVLDAENNPIPHLYSAGEFGGINANQYNGGGNLAECLIFGKIAGENAAKVKSDALMVMAANANDNAEDLGSNDMAAIDLSNYTVGENQYLGVSDADTGIGDQIVVRVTYKDQVIENVEVLEQHESEDIGLQAVEEMPKAMVAKNTVDVDAVSGASASSKAIKSAVKNAIAQAK